MAKSKEQGEGEKGKVCSPWAAAMVEVFPDKIVGDLHKKGYIPFDCIPVERQRTIFPDKFKKEGEKEEE